MNNSSHIIGSHRMSGVGFSREMCFWKFKLQRLDVSFSSICPLTKTANNIIQPKRNQQVNKISSFLSLTVQCNWAPFWKLSCNAGGKGRGRQLYDAVECRVIVWQLAVGLLCTIRWMKWSKKHSSHPNARSPHFINDETRGLKRRAMQCNPMRRVQGYSGRFYVTII